MFNINKKLLLKVLMVGMILLMLNFSAFSVIYHNHGDKGYEDSGDSYSAGSPINQYIIEGAGYFLAGYSDVLLLLNRFEMSDLKGFDFDELKEIVERSLNNLENAGATYDSLIALAENTPYNEAFLDKLTSFDYKSFRVNNSLNGDIFKEVEVFLKKGDITGTFKRSQKNFDLIIGILNSIKDNIDAKKMPPSYNLWKLNQVYAAELLFGQYTAQVYNALKNNDY